MSKKTRAVAGSREPVAGEEETTITLESGGISRTISESSVRAAAAKLLAEIDRPRRDTANIIAPAAEPETSASEVVGVAGMELRQIAQGLICEVREHRHLQHARILLLLVGKESVADGLAAGKRVCIGKAAKARPLDRLLAAVETGREIDDDGAEHVERARPDFVVRLSMDYLNAIGWPEKTESRPLAAALIDHELSHCGARIAGEFVDVKEVADREAELGDDLVETCRDVKDATGAILVRYYHRDKEGRLKWCVRKHDVEEFAGVVERHGPCGRDLLRLVDVLIKQEDLPLLREIDSGQRTVDSEGKPGEAA
jgi:hypothetical protein